MEMELDWLFKKRNVVTDSCDTVVRGTRQAKVC